MWVAGIPTVLSRVIKDDSRGKQKLSAGTVPKFFSGMSFFGLVPFFRQPEAP
jgi:hypothetical protein